MNKFIFILTFLAFIFYNPAEAKKIKSSLVIGKETKAKESKERVNQFNGIEFILDTVAGNSDSKEEFLYEELRQIHFAGYEKESNSSKETFLLVNPSPYTVTGFQTRVDYLDMQDRMLHSVVLKEAALVPAGETRKIDVKSWDSQHSYYYYLGNAPRKVATPYKVVFSPISFWIELPND